MIFGAGEVPKKLIESLDSFKMTAKKQSETF